MVRRLLSPLLLCLLTSCATGSDEPGDELFVCDETIEPRCAHPLDRVMIPMLAARGLGPETARPEELCRRLAVDLLGRIPSPEEAAACASQTPTQAIDAFLMTPEYQLTERRRWAQLVQVDVAREYYWGHIVDLDEIFAQHARGEMTYPDFAADVVVHPGFYGANISDAWGGALFRVFLGRAARQDEMDGLVPLQPVFGGRGLVVDGRVRDAWCRDWEGEDPCEVHGGYEYAASFCACTYDPLHCKTDVLGVMVDLSSAAAASCTVEGSEEEEMQLSRLGFRGTGDDATCLDGSAGCPDLYGYESGRLGELVEPLPEATVAERDALRSIGAALAARSDFWEAGADRALDRFLGWWQLGVKKPDWDVPEVRRVLARELRATGDLRHVQRLILTSQLYVRPIDSDTGTAPSEGESAPPPWTAGPIKMLSGDAWMHSVAAAVGETLGGCDPRTLGRVSEPDLAVLMAMAGFVPSPPVATVDLDLEEPWDNLHHILGSGLGACNSLPPPTQPNLSLVTNFADIGTQLCALGREVVPGGVAASATDEASLDAITTHLFRRLLSRDPSTDELQTQRGHLSACLAASDGCDDAHAAARWLCQRVIDSASFTLY